MNITLPIGKLNLSCCPSSSSLPYHRDLNSNNFMIDGRPLYPQGYHPVLIQSRYDRKGRAKHFNRTQLPPKYYIIDFGISRRYKPEDCPPLEPPIRGGDKSVPEFATGEPQNPFATDIYYVGNMIRQEFIEVCLPSFPFQAGHTLNPS